MDGIFVFGGGTMLEQLDKTEGLALSELQSVQDEDALQRWKKKENEYLKCERMALTPGMNFENGKKRLKMRSRLPKYL